MTCIDQKHNAPSDQTPNPKWNDPNIESTSNDIPQQAPEVWYGDSWSKTHHVESDDKTTGFSVKIRLFREPLDNIIKRVFAMIHEVSIWSQWSFGGLPMITIIIGGPPHKSCERFSLWCCQKEPETIKFCSKPPVEQPPWQCSFMPYNFTVRCTERDGSKIDTICKLNTAVMVRFETSNYQYITGQLKPKQEWSSSWNNCWK